MPISKPDLYVDGDRLTSCETSNVVPNWIISAHVRRALSLGLPEVVQQGEREGYFSLVAPGPSLPDIWEEVSGDIYAVGGAHDFLIERGRVPKAYIVADPWPHVVEYLKNPHPDVTYYVGSHCHQIVFHRLKDFDVRIWHSEIKTDTREILEERGGSWTIIGGGSTVSTRAPFLGYVLGYRKFGLYGADTSSKEGVSHSIKPITKGLPSRKVEFDGQEFEVVGNLIFQAHDWLQIMQLGHFDIQEVKAEGTLTHAIWRRTRRDAERERQNQPQEGAA